MKVPRSHASCLVADVGAGNPDGGGDQRDEQDDGGGDWLEHHDDADEGADGNAAQPLHDKAIGEDRT